MYNYWNIRRSVITLVFWAAGPIKAQTQRAVTARDCAMERQLSVDGLDFSSAIKLSPDGSGVLYSVDTPDVDNNQVNVELYVKKVLSGNIAAPRVVGNISQAKWLPDNRHITYLEKRGERHVIRILDIETNQTTDFYTGDSDISEYSIDQSGKVLVFTSTTSSYRIDNVRTPEEISKGYRIDFDESKSDKWPASKVFITRRGQQTWSVASQLIIQSPLNKLPVSELEHTSNMSVSPKISPDGTKLLVEYLDFSTEIPDKWRDSLSMKSRLNKAGVIQAFRLLVLYDLRTGNTSIPLESPWVVSPPLWSADSQSFVVSGRPPVGSELEEEAYAKQGYGVSAWNVNLLFHINVNGGNIQIVSKQLAYPWEEPLRWTDGGLLWVRSSAMDVLTAFQYGDGHWSEASSFKVPRPLGIDVASDGNYVIASYDDTQTSPELFIYANQTKKIDTFETLNPRFKELTFAQGREIKWKTSNGFEAGGLLLLPPEYQSGRRYPLVIQTKPFTHHFVCGFGTSPAFAPQPIANAGIIYLGQVAIKGSTQIESDYFPKGYPGGISEAAFNMDLWDSAIKELDDQGLVDKEHVGIIGFSRTGWYTEFILAHSQVKYRAATVADNIQLSLGEYWLNHRKDEMKSYDLSYGGPPYGDTLKNWLQYSVSFNLDKIHTPLLMEEMGNGSSAYIHNDEPPTLLAVTFEVLAGLNRLNKPVELYYYPNDYHEMRYPQSYFSSLQRNVDWYRFWLQGYERPNPEDPEQYKRWENMRKASTASR